MAKCTGVRCPMQHPYKVDECNNTDCQYRTEPITNADRIRAMSDKEIACFLAGKFTDRTTQMMMECGKMRSATEISTEADLWFRTWMKWLRMPAEVDMENKRQSMVNLEAMIRA